MDPTETTATVAVPAAVPPASTRLTVLYDERCAFCRRCRDWLAEQPCLVPVELLPSGSSEAKARYGAMPWLGEELIVADEHGQAWIGPAAFLMCLWATYRYRSWSYVLARPGLSKHTERFFLHVSKRRDRYGGWLGRKEQDCTYCDELDLWWSG